MASDADSVKPAETDSPQAPDEDDEHDPEAVTEVSAKGRPGLFVMLTCGFVACLCCVGGTFVGGSLTLARMVNLEEALDAVGAPEGWTMSDMPNTTPWSAEATWSGPSDAQAVTEWLLDEGARAAEDSVASCLSSGDTCTANLTSKGFPVTVSYGSGGEQAHATIHVD